MPVQQPYFQHPAATPQQPPRYQQPQAARQPQRQGRGDVYLPPMPEMLQARTPASAPAPPRYAQDPSKRNATPGSQAQAAVVRGQAPDEPAQRGSPSARVVLPSPEQLGLLKQEEARAPAAERRSEAAPSAAAVALDWPAAKARLEKVGALSYRLEKASEGGFRFTCVLPHVQGTTNERHFEARAAGEAEAVDLALAQAEAWSAKR